MKGRRPVLGAFEKVGKLCHEQNVKSEVNRRKEVDGRLFTSVRLVAVPTLFGLS